MWDRIFPRVVHQCFACTQGTCSQMRSHQNLTNPIAKIDCPAQLLALVHTLSTAIYLINQHHRRLSCKPARSLQFSLFSLAFSCCMVARSASKEDTRSLCAATFRSRATRYAFLRSRHSLADRRLLSAFNIASLQKQRHQSLYTIRGGSPSGTAEPIK